LCRHGNSFGNGGEGEGWEVVGTSTRFPVVQLLMNPESFEQTEIEKSAVGPQAEFSLPGMKLGVEFVEGRPVRVLFPEFAHVSVADTAPPIHQHRADVSRIVT